MRNIGDRVTNKKDGKTGEITMLKRGYTGYLIVDYDDGTAEGFSHQAADKFLGPEQLTMDFGESNV